MGNKDTNMLFGNCAIFIGASEVDMKPLKVVEDSIELDRLSAREKAQFKPLNLGSISFDCEMPIDHAAPIIGFDEALEPSRCALMIQSKPKINKPKNLKYPNKKRARRIWKKWKRRFGTTPGESICLTNVEIKHEGDNLIFTAKPIKND